MWMFVLGAYAVMSLVTFGFYGFDKRRARTGGWRVREGTLQALSLLGGWPGAIGAQTFFRHKRRKLAFMLVFAGIVVLHVAAWLVLLVRG